MKKAILIPILSILFLIITYLTFTYYPIFQLQRKLIKIHNLFFIEDKISQNIFFNSIEGIPKKYANLIIEFEKCKKFPFSNIAVKQIQKIGNDCSILPKVFLSSIKNKDKEIWLLENNNDNKFSPDFIRSKIKTYETFVHSLYENFKDIGGLGAYFKLTENKIFVCDLRDLKVGINDIKDKFIDITKGYSLAIIRCNNARSQIKKGLNIIDGVNTRFSEYENVENLRWAYEKYDDAVDHSRLAINDLRSALSVNYGNYRRTTIVYGIINNEYEKIQEIHSKIWEKRGDIYSAYSKARQEESTALGKLSRSLGRWWENTSKTKIGREIGIATKTLVLGTQVFYEMLSMGANEDIFSVAERHNGEMDQIINEVQETELMEGISIMDLSPEHAISDAIVSTWYNNLFGPQKRTSSYLKDEKEFIKIETGELFPEPEVTQNYEKYESRDRLDLITPCYVICSSSWKTEKEANKSASELKRQGYSAGYLWIPDYNSLSGAKFYLVYIGPYETKNDCKNSLDSYRSVNKNSYGILVSHSAGRVEVR